MPAAMASSRGETVVGAQSWRFFPAEGGQKTREEFQTHFFSAGILNVRFWGDLIGTTRLPGRRNPRPDFDGDGDV
jgi:hypothetical protein